MISEEYPQMGKKTGSPDIPLPSNKVPSLKFMLMLQRKRNGLRIEAVQSGIRPCQSQRTECKIHS
ncbi:hypothetical protein Mapa_013257 [Marchantia paleacea]|nr:hypothetical protein Mapa_013257 [Marchantia paleacea]